MKKDIKEKEGTWITIYFKRDETKEVEDFKKKYMGRISGIAYINKPKIMKKEDKSDKIKVTLKGLIIGYIIGYIIATFLPIIFNVI